jgi:hypothetical protein
MSTSSLQEGDKTKRKSQLLLPVAGRTPPRRVFLVYLALRLLAQAVRGRPDQGGGAGTPAGQGRPEAGAEGRAGATGAVCHYLAGAFFLDLAIVTNASAHRRTGNSCRSRRRRPANDSLSLCGRARRRSCSRCWSFVGAPRSASGTSEIGWVWQHVEATWEGVARIDSADFLAKSRLEILLSVQTEVMPSSERPSPS